MSSMRPPIGFDTFHADVLHVVKVFEASVSSKSPLVVCRSLFSKRVLSWESVVSSTLPLAAAGWVFGFDRCLFCEAVVSSLGSLFLFFSEAVSPFASILDAFEVLRGVRSSTILSFGYMTMQVGQKTHDLSYRASCPPHPPSRRNFGGVPFEKLMWGSFLIGDKTKVTNQTLES